MKQSEQKNDIYDKNSTKREVRVKKKSTQIMTDKLIERISDSLIGKNKKDVYIRQLSNLEIEIFEQGYLSAEKKISNMDMKYIICFTIEMDVKDISLLFNIEPASVRTARYRIRKKFGEKNTFRFLI